MPFRFEAARSPLAVGFGSALSCVICVAPMTRLTEDDGSGGNMRISTLFLVNPQVAPKTPLGRIKPRRGT
jgi:hypothetical protein